MDEKVSASILSAAMVVSSVGGFQNVSAAEGEVGGTAETATAYTVGEQVKGNIDNNEDVDCFSFTTDGSDSFYELTFANTGIDDDAYCGIFKDAEMLEAIVEDTQYLKNSGNYNLEKLEQNHTYYVRLRANNTGSYQFQLTKTTDDVKDDTQEAESVAVGTEVKKALQNTKDVDCFSFTTDGSDSFYEFNLGNTGVDGDVYYNIYKDAEMVNLIKYDVVTYKYNNYHNFAKLEKNHTYYIKIDGSNSGAYQLKVTKTPDDVTDVAGQAMKLELNQTKGFMMENTEDTDWFKFETTDSENYTFTFNNIGNKEATIQVYSSEDYLDSQKVFEYILGERMGLPEDCKTLKLDSFKTYYIKVTGDIGAYEVGVSAATSEADTSVAAPASIKASKAGSKKVTVKWKKVNDATGYEVYRAQGKKGKYKKVKTIKKAATVKFTDKKGLKKGKTYSYKVRAYKNVSGKKYYSEFSSVKSVKFK